MIPSTNKENEELKVRLGVTASSECGLIIEIYFI